MSEKEDKSGEIREPPPPPRRINVAVTPDMMAAIDKIMDREGVTLTEAVRRLIGYGDFAYTEARINKAGIFVRYPDGKEKEVILI